MKNENIGFRNGKLFCFNCGGSYEIKEPIPVPIFTGIMKGFEEMHNDCEKTWEEPKINSKLDIEQKISWWWNNGERGMSSETMWNCLSGKKDFKVSIPYDPDDFKRCYKLLEVIPEWKTELNKLKKLSKTWCNYVDNWELMTMMYESHLKKNENRMVDLYDLMQELQK